LWLALAIVTGLLAVSVYKHLETKPQPAKRAETSPNDDAVPAVRPLDPQIIRTKAWTLAQRRLEEADQACTARVEKSLRRVHEFFAERKRQTRQFGEVVLSLRGKWSWVRSKLPLTDSEQHFRFLREQFEAHVFTPMELTKTIEDAVVDYFDSAQAIDNQLLSQIRTDLRGDEFRQLRAIPVFQDRVFPDDAAQKLLGDVNELVAQDLGVDATKKVGVAVAAVVVERIAERVLFAVATRLGISAGIVSTGAASGAVTFGVGLIAAIIVDLTVDSLMQLAGFDPEEQVAQKINATLDRAYAEIADGDPEVHGLLEDWQRAADTEDDELRAKASKAAAAIVGSGHLGLRWELQHLDQIRVKRRHELLRKVILEGEAL
jgi:hypothetical protein